MKPSFDRRLDAFLAAVHDEVLPLGVREHLDVRMLLRRSQSRGEPLDGALVASLLATDVRQYRRVVALFQAHCAEDASQPAVKPGAALGRQVAAARLPVLISQGFVGTGLMPTRNPAQTGWRAGLRRAFRAAVAPVLVLAVLGLLIAALVSGEAVLYPGERSSAGAVEEPEVAFDESPVAAPTGQFEPYELPARGRTPRPGDAVPLLVGFVLLVAGLRWFLLPTEELSGQKRRLEAQAEQGREERERLSREAESSPTAHLVPYVVPRHLPVSESVVEDTATLLGRLYQPTPGRDLDVEATVDTSLRQGGRFTPILEPGRAARPTLVLIDRDCGDYPGLGGFLRLLDRWERGGVHLRRYFFDHSLDTLRLEGSGPPLSIEDFERREAGSPLLVFSLGPLIRDMDRACRWPAVLRGWEDKVWLDPDATPVGDEPNRLGLTRSMTALGFIRYPLTGAGLFALCERLVRPDGDPAPPAVAPLPDPSRPEVRRALRAWALCGVLVPDATWDQLEAVRRDPDFPEVGEVLDRPWHVHLLLRWLTETFRCHPVSPDGRGLLVPRQAIRQLRREHRRDGHGLNADLERRACALWKRQLRDDAPANSLLLLRTQLRLASYLLAGVDVDEGLAICEALRGTAVHDEVMNLLEETWDLLEASTEGRRPLDADQGAGLKVELGRTEGVPLKRLIWGNRLASARAVGWAGLLWLFVVAWLIAGGLLGPPLDWPWQMPGRSRVVLVPLELVPADGGPTVPAHREED